MTIDSEEGRGTTVRVTLPAGGGTAAGQLSLPMGA